MLANLKNLYKKINYLKQQIRKCFRKRKKLADYANLHSKKNSKFAKKFFNFEKKSPIIIKYSKKSKIRLIKYPIDGSATFTDPDNIETFKTWKVKEHVQKINEIKDDYDVCLTMSSERVAYLADLNYISYYVGGDIEAPRFQKNSRKLTF